MSDSEDDFDSAYDEPMRIYEFDDAIVELLDPKCYGTEPRDRLTAEKLKLTGTYFERLGAILYRDLILPYFPDMRRRINWTIPDLTSPEGLSKSGQLVLMHFKGKKDTPFNHVFTLRKFVDDPATLIPRGPHNLYRDIGVKWCRYDAKWRYCSYSGNYSPCPNVYNGYGTSNMMRLDSGRYVSDNSVLQSLPRRKEKKFDYRRSRCILPCGLHLIFSRHDPPNFYLANWRTLRYVKINWPHPPNLATDDFGNVCVPPRHAAATWYWLTFMPIEQHVLEDLEECK